MLLDKKGLAGGELSDLQANAEISYKIFGGLGKE
jgi:hypothetical protein